MTGQKAFAHPTGTGTGRMLLAILLVAAGLALVGFVIAVGLRFALPQPVFTEIGSVEDFPPSDQPYEIYADGGVFFVVNTADELIALHALSPLKPHCRIHWVGQESRFIDPCPGTQFWLDGSYHFGPPASMERYPVVVTGGVVKVDQTRILPGPEPAVGDIYTEFR